MRIAFLFAACLPATVLAQSYVNFEAPHTNSIAVSADGRRLYALNTPDNRLAVFQLDAGGAPSLIKEVRVGLGPVSVRPRTADEVWVVNFVSDSVSVVSISQGVVTDTIYVKDEPGDVVFAGSPMRAFVSVGTDREVRVFDVDTHARVGTVAVFGDDPRSLAVSDDGDKVWVAVHRSGNGTTVVPEFMAPKPPPPNGSLPAAPQQSIVVDADDPNWSQLDVTLPDVDVVEIDAATLAQREYRTVGTILFHLAQRPGTDELWVANTEALNRVRFEPNLKGHVVDNRVTRIRTGVNPGVQPFELNPGIDYSVLPNAGALSTALAQPTDIEFDPLGGVMFIAAYGTDRIGVCDPATGGVGTPIEIGSARGATAAPRSKRGPRALAHHPSEPVLYSMNRISNTISVIDTLTGSVKDELSMVFDPTPRVIKEGRGFLYDAKLSGNGTASCASCHQDGTFDGVGWDLGDPSGPMQEGIDILGTTFPLHPMKGLMLTQTLQGLKDLDPLHWRGDKRVFQDFNGAFKNLLGRSRIPAQDMDDYRTFIESIVYPGNPNQNLDRTMPTAGGSRSAAAGATLFTDFEFQTRTRCTDCHSVTTGTRRIILPGFQLAEPQPLKAAQLRNVYKRTGKKPRPRGRTSGFGLQYDGRSDSVVELLTRPVFGLLINDLTRRSALESFLEAFDTGTAPIVGYTRTVHQANAGATDVINDLGLMMARAGTPDTDLVAFGKLDGEEIGFAYDALSQTFVPDERFGATRTAGALRAAIAAGRGTLSFMCVPPGSGVRIGVDRDLDFEFDGDERPNKYGSATPACAPELRVDVSSPPRLDNELFGIVASNGPPNSVGGLLISPWSANVPLADLEILVDSPSGFVMSLWLGPDGIGVVPIPLPDAPVLTGVQLYVQGISIHPCGVLGVNASRGLHVTIGN